MAPTSVLIKLTPTTTTMNNNNPTTLTNNNISLSNETTKPTSSYFDVYQKTKISSSEVSIRTFILVFISTERYRKALITKQLPTRS